MNYELLRTFKHTLTDTNTLELWTQTHKMTPTRMKTREKLFKQCKF